MSSRVLRIRGSCLLIAWFAAVAPLMSGCLPTKEDRRCAVEAINKDFRGEYETILAKDGTRVYPVTRAEAYQAVRVSMARLRMTVESQDPVLGFVSVYAAAPLPLSEEEWKEASGADLPRARNVIRPCVGVFNVLFVFEPKGLESVIRGTVVQAPAGTAISFTARMREIAPPETGFPRREYLPPTAVKIALDRIWREVEREFKATVRRP
jgi:hypothetical protein